MPDRAVTAMPARTSSMQWSRWRRKKNAMPQATFGQVVAHVCQAQALNEQIIGILEAINALRNRNFGHGMTAPFGLSAAEVDFTYLACTGVSLLFARTP